MKYNLLPESICSLCEDNSVYMHYSNLIAFSNYSDVSLLTMSGVDILSIEFDLKDRVALDRIEYKFISYNGDVSSTASGIKFYYKNNLVDNYNIIPVEYYGDWMFLATLSGSSASSPRYIKLTHDISQTDNTPSPSGVVYGMKAFNDDTVVSFGYNGDKDNDYLEIVRDGTEYIREIPIYNNGNTTADALVYIEPTYSDLDNVIELSDNINGPWYSTIDGNTIFLDDSNMNNGSFDGTCLRNNSVFMQGGVLYNGTVVTASGISRYTTPIFSTSQLLEKKRLFINHVLNGGRFAVSEDDNLHTIEIRCSNELPKPYSIMRVLYSYYSSGYWFAYRDLWTEDMSIKEVGSTYINSNTDNFPIRNYGIVIGDEDDMWAGWLSTDSTSDSRYFSDLYLYTFDNDKSYIYNIAEHNSGGKPMNFYIKDFYINSDGGIWVYMFAQSYRSNNFIDASGYYIAHFTKTLSNTFKWFSSDDTIYQIASNYGNNDLWYTDIASSSIYKISTYGDVLIEVKNLDYTSNLGPIHVLPDGVVIFSNNSDIHYMQDDGFIIEELSILNISDQKVDYLIADKDYYNFIWIISDFTVKRIFTSGERKGQVDFEIRNIGSPVKLTSYSGGVLVKCSESGIGNTVTMRFISIANRRVDFEYPMSRDSEPTMIFTDFKDETYLEKINSIKNNPWNSVKWNKVVMEGCILPTANFSQIRFTLRRPLPYEVWKDIELTAKDTYKDGDLFNGISPIPDRSIWGMWSNYPYTDRVFIDTSNEALILKPGFVNDSFIDTDGRLIYGLDQNGFLELVVRYKIGAGNGIVSGKQETINIYLNSMNPGTYGYNINLRMTMPTTPNTNYTTLRIYKTDGTSQEVGINMDYSLNYYEGELRIVLNRESSAIGGWRTYDSTVAWSSYTGSLTYNSTAFGNLFSLKISGSKSGSDVYIKDVRMVRGMACATVPSPEIKHCGLLNQINLNNIPSKSYKTLYAKLSANENMLLSDNAAVDLRTSWRVPV